MELKGSITAFDTCGTGYMERARFDFFPYSRERLSMKRETKPEPVAPPKEWNTRVSILTLSTSVGVVCLTDGCVAGHHCVAVDPMLQPM